MKKQERERSPIEPDHPGADPETSGAVEIAQRHLRRLTVVEQVVIDEPGVLVLLIPDEKERHHPPPNRLVTTERLDEDRERGQKDHVDSRRQHIPEHVFAELEIRETK